jgi:hypothetical protein
MALPRIQAGSAPGRTGGPPADADSPEVEFGVKPGGLVQRGHLIFEYRSEHIAVNLAFPVGSAPRRAPPVGYQDREPQLGEPLRHMAAQRIDV